MSTLREDVQFVVQSALRATQPQHALKQALSTLNLRNGRIRVIAIGKAACSMASAASEVLGRRIESGLVITKYGHTQGRIPGFRIMEAAHPLPDENSLLAADVAIDMVQGLHVDDTVLMLISGGGSALFEKPLIPLPLFSTTTNALLRCGASIQEMNIIRKRLSAVKGGRFAKLCAPATVIGLVLSDVMGDSPEVIASGPISPDPTTAQEAQRILYRLLPDAPPIICQLMQRETPKTLHNAQTKVIANVELLVSATAQALNKLGYETHILTDRLTCEAREAGRMLGSIAITHQSIKHSVAYIAGGETVVHVTGDGIGGRNQELALAAAPALDGLRDTCLFSLGSDGTDGPTDAAGGYVDHRTAGRLRTAGIDIGAALQNSDSYPTLKACEGLLMTGPTGTNVNDVSVVMIRR